MATNNLVAARGPTELFDAMKRFDRLMASPGAACGTLQEELEYKLEEGQKMTLLFTRLLVLMHSNKLPACRELASVLQASRPLGKNQKRVRVRVRFSTPNPSIYPPSQP